MLRTARQLLARQGIHLRRVAANLKLKRGIAGKFLIMYLIDLCEVVCLYVTHLFRTATQIDRTHACTHAGCKKVGSWPFYLL